MSFFSSSRTHTQKNKKKMKKKSVVVWGFSFRKKKKTVVFLVGNFLLLFFYAAFFWSQLFPLDFISFARLGNLLLLFDDPKVVALYCCREYSTTQFNPTLESFFVCVSSVFFCVVKNHQIKSRLSYRHGLLLPRRRKSTRERDDDDGTTTTTDEEEGTTWSTSALVYSSTGTSDRRAVSRSTRDHHHHHHRRGKDKRASMGREVHESWELRVASTTTRANDDDKETPKDNSNNDEDKDIAVGASFGGGGRAMMRASMVVVLSLCFFLAVAAGGTKFVLRQSSAASETTTTTTTTTTTGTQSTPPTADDSRTSSPSSGGQSARTFRYSSSSSGNRNDDALIGFKREEPFIDANEKSIASEGVSLDGWFHISASLFAPSSSNTESSSNTNNNNINNNDKKAYVFPPALSKPDKNFGWRSEGDLGAKLVSQKGENVARAAFTAHRRTFITDSDLTSIKRSGLTHVRVPITWAMFAEDEEFERGEEIVVVDPMYRDRMFIQASREDLREMVKKIKKNDLRVVLALKGMPGGASNDEGDGAWPHEASFFREFSKVLSAEEDSEENKRESSDSSDSNQNRKNRKLLFGGTSSSTKYGEGRNKKLIKAKTIAETGETATANFLNWLANLDDDLKSTVVGVSLIDAPTAKDPKQRAAALTWLERTSQMYREIIVDPLVKTREVSTSNKNNNNSNKKEKKEEASLPFLHVTMSPTMGIDVDEMAKWMRKTFTTDERSTWAALDVQHAFPRGVGACIGGPSRGCAFSCSDSVEQVARSIGDASDSFARELRSAASEHGVPHVAVSEWSLSAEEEGQCPNAGQFLDAAFAQQVRAHRASNVRGYFWRWKSVYDNIENQNESMSNQMTRKKQVSSNSLREYLSNRGGKSGIVSDAMNEGINGGKVSTAGWMDEGGIARDDKFDRFKPKDKVIPYDYKTPEEFDDEMQMHTVADDWSSRMTNAISEAKGTGSSNIMDLLAEEDEGLGTSEKDIEKALLNPDADASVKTIKGFESESEKRKKLIDSMKAFGESASRFDSLTSKKGGLSVVDENDEIFNENGTR